MNQPPYRVVPRATAAAIGVLLLAVSAIVVWFAIQKMRATTAALTLLYEQAPEQAMVEVVHRVHFYAWLYGSSLLAIALWVAWTAFRAIRSQSMPPPGSWIIEGQRTHAGDNAVRRGRILLCCAAVLALGAGGLFVMLWRLAATVELPQP